MQVYLVGGAVRDQLLGRTVTERDYVVVGATPEQMLAAGYLPVGSDFPVFLHPQSKEEYALARTERKSGVGYAGFTFYTSPDLSLEQDLIRRDLTINAMAMTEQGSIIDPYGGQQDLQQRILRHVSPAFVEDPLRVLRVARFAARYAPLGFSIAPETLRLMQALVQQGEIKHLTPERIWKETQRALNEDRAEVYFEVLRQCGALQVIMPEVNALFGVPQRPAYHPEIDAGIHTMMTLQRACEANYSDRVRFATVMHDLGKALTPVDLLPRHTEHEARGVEPIRVLCKRLKVPSQYQQLAELVCREHLCCHRVMELRPGAIWRLLQRLDVLRRPERVEEFIQACECDARGRLGLETRPYEQAKFMREAVQQVRNIRAIDLPSHVQGPDIGEALIKARIKALSLLKARYLIKPAT